MEIDRGDEWQRLYTHYGAMYDDELLRLAADFANLTEIAQQVLRDEMRKRALPDPATHDSAKKEGAGQRYGGKWEQPRDWTSEAALADAEAAALERRGLLEDEPDAVTHKYTWKTLLCDCVDYEHAWQLHEALRQAGIESWIEPNLRLHRDTPRQVMVAADELERAGQIASQPIPPDVVEESKSLWDEMPEYESPKCPKCGAAEPVLVGTEPGNAWACHTCGHDWEELAEAPEKK